jgi:hypothetical protein
MAVPFRKHLDHTQHFAGRFGAIYFVTICSLPRGFNRLCHSETASILFETSRRYHEQQLWYLHLLVLMPDHLHARWNKRSNEPLLADSRLQTRYRKNRARKMAA